VTDKRMYGQFCGIAAALDVIGERWTLLIVRELLLGPARFNELCDNLPGLGPNLLSARLQTLSTRGVIESAAVAGDARGKLYALTDFGQGLRRPVLGLARWGMRLLGESADDSEVGVARDAWGFLAVEAMIDDGMTPEVDESYEFRVGAEVFHLRVADGQARAGRGTVTDPAIVVTTDADTFIRIGAQLLSPFEAAVTGRLSIEGDGAAVERCTRLLGLAPTTPLPPRYAGRG
jgi:DNA-binding HxlR family transcriptional regulator